MKARLIRTIRQSLCRHNWIGHLSIDREYHDRRYCTKWGKWETLWSGTMKEWRQKHGA